MSEIVLCRHGTTEHNVAGAFLSTTDVSLNAHGRAQCEQVRELLPLAELTRCAVSPMRRCLETRAIVAPELPFAIDPNLREIDFGAWEGKTKAWLEANDPNGLAARYTDPVRFRPPGGESFEDVAARLAPLADSLRATTGTLVIAHRGSLGVLERLLRGLPLEEQTVAPFEPGEFRILRLFD